MISCAEVGMCGVLEHIVCEKDLATAWRNNVPVLATPILLWLAELAAMKAVEEDMPDGVMTVGMSHSMRHLAPTPIGFSVLVEAKVTAVVGSFITFDVTAHNGSELILLGTHERAIVERDRFLARIGRKRCD